MIDGLKTILQMADQFEEPPARIRYIIQRDRIKPAEVIGNVSLYDNDAQARVKTSLFGMRIQK